MTQYNPDDLAPWWNYPLKEQWFAFRAVNPDVAEQISRLQMLIPEIPGDRFYTAQIEVKQLRIAERLGLVEVDWSSWDGVFD